MSKTDSQPASLQREDWDFSSVPERDIEECLLWECGREWSGLLDEFARWLKPELFVGMIDNELDLTANVREWDSLFHILLKGPFPSSYDIPWQLLPEECKGHLANLRVAPLSEISVEVVHERKTQMAELGIKDNIEKYFAFGVDWHKSDTQILAAFSSWLKKRRKYKAREERGVNSRERLRMIGAMRLLHSMPFAQAFDLTVSVLGSPLYGKRPSWERARKAAAEVFRTDFFYDSGALKVPPTPISFAKFDAKSLQISGSMFGAPIVPHGGGTDFALIPFKGSKRNDRAKNP